MNEFYLIGEHGKQLTDEFQLENLGEKVHSMTIGTSNGSYSSYRNTTDEDYDRSFAYKLSRIKPPYEINKLLEYHLEYYLTQVNGIKEKFQLQMKYVIIPILQKMKDKQVYVDIIEEWLSSNKETNEKIVTTMNIINTGDINSPTQFQQNSTNSSQKQEVEIKNANTKEFLEILKKEVSEMKSEISEELKLEINYAINQHNKGKDTSVQIQNITKLMKDIGIGIFTNILSNPVSDFIKPLLGI